jgi:hypothetical protein
MNNNNKYLLTLIYKNVCLDKSLIIKENKNISGVYM